MEIMVCDIVATYLMILLLVCCDTPCRYSVLALPYIIVCVLLLRYTLPMLLLVVPVLVDRVVCS